jgi:predicted membrane-bound mannosyltransferase
MPAQANIETSSAVFLNGSSQLLQEFLQTKQHRQVAHDPARLKKLTQSDKDMLVDIAQLATLEPFDYMQIANQAYILTLDSTFADINPYIQKLVQTIAAMDTDPNFAMTREEILERIDQFYSNLVRQR